MTPWGDGCFLGDAELPFGRMYEDPAIELDAFAAGSRVFTIASAGCTARVLAAAGHEVTAVDIHARQVAYARYRAAGGAAREGRAERLVAGARRLLGLAGWSGSARRAFFELEDPAEQVDFWDRHLDSRRWRVAVDTLLAPSLLRWCYAGPFVDSLAAGFGGLVRSRLRRCWATHPNRSNPYAGSLFGQGRWVEPGPGVRTIRFVHADAAAYLESCAGGCFDGFSLSNIVDGVSAAYRRRLYAAVRGAGTPGAMVVSRSFGERGAGLVSNLAARDRSPVWGVVDVRRCGELE